MIIQWIKFLHPTKIKLQILWMLSEVLRLGIFFISRIIQTSILNPITYLVFFFKKWNYPLSSKTHKKQSDPVILQHELIDICNTLRRNNRLILSITSGFPYKRRNAEDIIHKTKVYSLDLLTQKIQRIWIISKFTIVKPYYVTF